MKFYQNLKGQGLALTREEGKAPQEGLHHHLIIKRGDTGREVLHPLLVRHPLMIDLSRETSIERLQDQSMTQSRRLNLSYLMAAKERSALRKTLPLGMTITEDMKGLHMNQDSLLTLTIHQGNHHIMKDLLGRTLEHLQEAMS